LGEFLEALGYDRNRDDLRDTPALVVDAYQRDLLCGEDIDVRALIEQGSIPGRSRSLVVVEDIAVCTLCPHHLLPAEGRATVAYVPGKRLLGLGTLTALVDAFSRRLTLQEHITEAVVDALMQTGGAEGAYCRLSLEQACLRLRGKKQASATVTTSAVDGCLRDGARAEELRLQILGRK
jgi:GTP cyclohydrolase I